MGTMEDLFQLTTSRRGRPLQSTEKHQKSHFNSRPHEEVDGIRETPSVRKRISTHDLSKRSTLLLTLLSHSNTHFNSRPHEEVDSIPILQRMSGYLFQLTTSRRGRPTHPASDDF